MALNPKVFEEVSKIFKAYLETKELRKTPERFAILEEIYSRTEHFDVESLFISMINWPVLDPSLAIWRALIFEMEKRAVSDDEKKPDKKRHITNSVTSNVITIPQIIHPIVLMVGDVTLISF